VVQHTVSRRETNEVLSYSSGNEDKQISFHLFLFIHSSDDGGGDDDDDDG
jgi:hypothetical protein